MAVTVWLFFACSVPACVLGVDILRACGRGAGHGGGAVSEGASGSEGCHGGAGGGGGRSIDRRCCACLVIQGARTVYDGKYSDAPIPRTPCS